MIRRMCLGLLASMLFAINSAAIHAAEEPAQPYVVLVGIDKYQDPQILPRQHCEADAKALYDLFVSKDYLGADAKHIKLLLGSADEKRSSQLATRDNVLKAIEWLKTAGKNQLVVFAFFGQGAPVGERACYFCVDSTYKNRAKDAVVSGDIEQDLKLLKSENFVAFIDVNFLGFDSGKEPRPDPHLNKFYTEFLGGDEDAEERPSRVVFLANSGLKPSLNLKDHGIFTEALIEGLKGKADVEGYEPDGVITVEELAKYVRDELPELARKHGKVNEEKDQQPIVLESQTSNFVIDLNPTVYPKAHARLMKFDEMIKDGSAPKSLAEEGHNLLSHMPKLEAQQELRRAYQAFVDGTTNLAKFQQKRETIMSDTRISEREASNYAEMVIRAARVVRQGFFKKTEQGDLVASAVTGLYKQVNEKIPSKISDQMKNPDALNDDDLRKLLVDARTHLGKREDLDKGNDVTYSLRHMLTKLDRHTDYIDPEMLNRLKVTLQGKFSGIGVQIRKNNIRDQLEVVTPLRGSPAYKAGMYKGDIITSIIRDVDSEGNPLPKPEVISTKGMSTNDAVKKILGKEGTPVKLLVEREGEAKPLEFNLIRGSVELETVMGIERNADDSWNYVIDPDNKICYIRLTEFSHNTYRDLEQAMKKLAKDMGIKGFILDLRFNPGGLLDQAVKITDLFIDDGLIVTIRPRNGPETSYIGKSDGSYTEFPMVCLVNGHSASASEIVSAALQDHHRAIIIGSRSYGKGSVQTIHPFDTGGRLKLTTATFWRPSNRNLNKASTEGRPEDEWGVTPDNGFIMDLPTKELNDLQEAQRETEIIKRPDKRGKDSKMDFRDRQLDTALNYLRLRIKSAAQASTTQKAG